MKQFTGNEVRSMFLKFFESKGHKIEPSHSLIPENDPTLLWINAGVSALKKYFDGSVKPDVPRITNAQKSIRTNDIENVGKTARHHTFFEMLGNFSIGDYFKKEAIDFAWEFLTGEAWLGMDPDKLYITVHDHDEEAYHYWVDDKGVDPSHMLKTPGNFWEIGEGPCGPDSEIFYDRGEKYDPEKMGIRLFKEELENDRYIEIWNLVFSQYNAKEGVAQEDYEELPQKNIDTGMGLERLVSIIQEGETNFDTDLFLPIIHACEKKAKISYQEEKMAYRVIADHIRTVTFALADGALFDNAGRGYVLRRILRRAVRYGKKIGIEGAFMYQLVAIVSDMMKDYYDYLPAKVEYIAKLVRIEEESFHKTLADGEKMLNGLIEKTTQKELDGTVAFKLYDTYGFPYELTEEIASEHGLTVDREGFEKEMEKQRQRAKEGRVSKESMKSQKPDLMNFVLLSQFDYCPDVIEAKVIGLFKDGIQCESIDDEGEIILDKTTFYAEMGGQCADTGTMSHDRVHLTVENVLKAPHGQAMHFVKVDQGCVKVGDVLTLHVDVSKRECIENNHTATHLLQRALKDVLGDHVSQAGSYVDESRLRFDFTHFEKVSEEDLRKVEDLVNDHIFAREHVDIEYMKKEEALQSGAMALFDEKYGDIVRVVRVGQYSTELCGGCHVANTASIGLFKIVSEESVGSGVRRIEACTGKQAYLELKAEEEKIQKIMALLKVKNRQEVVQKVMVLSQDLAQALKENEKLSSQLTSLQAKDKMKDVQDIHGISCLFVHLASENAKKAKTMTLEYRDLLKSGLVVVTCQEEDKISYYVALTKDVIERGYQAGNLIKVMNQVCDGRGGGKPDFAQGGTKQTSRLNDIIEAIKHAL